MRLEHATFAEKPTLKFTSADGSTPYVRRQSLTLRGPQGEIEERVYRSSTGDKNKTQGAALGRHP